MNCFPYFVLILLCATCTWAEGERDDELNLEERQSEYTCGAACGGVCRKRCLPVVEEESSTPDSCTCPSKQNKKCCIPSNNLVCESDCEGKCRSKCRIYEIENTACGCKGSGQVCCNEQELMCEDFNATCVPRGCRHRERILHHVHCRHQNRYCCKATGGEDCEEVCGGKCRRRCRLYEAQIDSCPCSRGTNRVCCYEEPMCTDYGGTCRPRGCLSHEVVMHHKYCSHENRFCCRPTPPCEETIQDVSGTCKSQCEGVERETAHRTCEDGKVCCLPPPPGPTTCPLSVVDGGCAGQCRMECIPGQTEQPACPGCVDNMKCCSPPLLPNP